MILLTLVPTPFWYRILVGLFVSEMPISDKRSDAEPTNDSCPT